MTCAINNCKQKPVGRFPITITPTKGSLHVYGKIYYLEQTKAEYPLCEKHAYDIIPPTKTMYFGRCSKRTGSGLDREDCEWTSNQFKTPTEAMKFARINHHVHTDHVFIYKVTPSGNVNAIEYNHECYNH